MKYKIKNAPPIGYNLTVKILKLLGVKLKSFNFDDINGFAFGDTIYSKHLPEFRPDVFIHEREHLRQMKFSKFYALYHFLRCILDEEYFYNSELEAYAKQMEYIKEVYGWDEKDIKQKFITTTAEHLSQDRFSKSRETIYNDLVKRL